MMVQLFERLNKLVRAGERSRWGGLAMDKFDLIIIGGGGGGYPAPLRLDKASLL
jgi:hypothetical protein